MEKYEWFERFELEATEFFCYCCEYTFRLAGKNIICKYCPIDWGGINCENHGQGLFALWFYAKGRKNWQEAGKLALQIAELPEREEI